MGRLLWETNKMLDFWPLYHLSPLGFLLPVVTYRNFCQGIFAQYYLPTTTEKTTNNRATYVLGETPGTARTMVFWDSWLVLIILIGSC